MRHNKTSVINATLSHVAAPGITSSFEDSPTAAVANAAYNRALDYCLSLYDWTFATREKYLAESADISPASFKHAYRLPPDCLRIVSAKSDKLSQIEEYDILEFALHTDADAVLLRYISAEAAETMPDAFADALAWRIAIEISPNVEHGGTDLGKYVQMYEQSLDAAKVWNDQQAPRQRETYPILQERFG